MYLALPRAFSHAQADTTSRAQVVIAKTAALHDQAEPHFCLACRVLRTVVARFWPEHREPTIASHNRIALQKNRAYASGCHTLTIKVAILPLTCSNLRLNAMWVGQKTADHPYTFIVPQYGSVSVFLPQRIRDLAALARKSRLFRTSVETKYTLAAPARNSQLFTTSVSSSWKGIVQSTFWQLQEMLQGSWLDSAWRPMSWVIIGWHRFGYRFRPCIFMIPQSLFATTTWT